MLDSTLCIGLAPQRLQLKTNILQRAKPCGGCVNGFRPSNSGVKSSRLYVLGDPGTYIHMSVYMHNVHICTYTHVKHIQFVTRTYLCPFSIYIYGTPRIYHKILRQYSTFALLSDGFFMSRPLSHLVGTVQQKCIMSQSFVSLTTKLLDSTAFLQEN